MNLTRLVGVITGCPKNNVTPVQRQLHENNKHERCAFLTYVSHLLPDTGKDMFRNIRHQHVQLLWTDLGPDRSNVPGQRAFRLFWCHFDHLLPGDRPKIFYRRQVGTISRSFVLLPECWEVRSAPVLRRSSSMGRGDDLLKDGPGHVQQKFSAGNVACGASALETYSGTDGLSI